VKPVYFRYLTLMSYHVFLQEGVDAAVYEVGIGGQYDSTNVVENPAVTGISTLGIDHVFALGNTIEKIAWHKGGIQKKGAPSFTVKQSPGALAVVQGRAEETKVKTLTILDEDSRLAGVKIRPDAAFQRLNASLAIKLAETALQKLDPKFEICPTLPKEFVDGLEQVVWRGRCELKKEGNVTWYLDGAHTQDSIMVATNWFVGESFQKYEISVKCIDTRHRPGTRVLIFNQQGHREAIALLEELFRAVKSQESLHFDHVIFCPTIPSDKLGRPGSDLNASSFSD
jgi:folylpolyglutamate synthase